MQGSGPKSVAVRTKNVSYTYTSDFHGLATLPCHALVDSGAQDGVVGLWHWQRWAVCLAIVHKKMPVFQPLPNECQTSGIGGGAKVLAICDMPTGLAGLNGVTRWVVVQDPSQDQAVPPLIPIKLLKMLDKEEGWQFEYIRQYQRFPYELSDQIIDHACGPGVGPVPPPGEFDGNHIHLLVSTTP